MANQIIKRKFELTGDSTGAVNAVQDAEDHVKKAEQALRDSALTTEKLNDAFAELNRQNEIEDLAKSAARYAAETGNARTAQLQLNAALQKAGASHSEIQKAVRAYSSEIKRVTRETEDAADAAKRYDEAFTEASFKSAAYGDIDTSIGTFRGLADTLSPGSGEGLTIVQDIFAAREGLERLGPGLKFLGESASQGTGILGTLSSSLTAAIPGLTGTAAGLGAIALAAAPFAAAAAVAAGAFAIVSAGLENARLQAEAFAKGVAISTRAEIEARTLAEQGRFEDLAELRKEAGDTSIAQGKYLDGLLAQRAELQNIYDTTSRLSPAFAEAKRNIDALNVTIDEATKEAAEAATRAMAITAITDEYAAQARLAQELADKQERLREAQLDLEKAEQELSQTRERHTLAIEQLNAQEEQAFADWLKRSRETSAQRVTADNREREDRNLALQRKQADLDAELLKQAEAFEAQQTAIAERGAAAILAIRDDLAKREADTLTKIADLRAKAAADDQKALLKYQKERARAEEDFRRNQDRARESYEQSQLDAILNNDVAAFLSNRTEFRTDRRRNREDFRTEGGRAFEDFEEERAARQAALEARIAEINTELEAYRAAQLAKIAEIEIQTAKELELNQLAYEEKLRLDADARKITNEREAEDLRIRAERRSADRILEDQKASEALTAALTRIDTQRIAQNAALDAAILKAQQFKAVVNSITFGGGGGGYTGAGGSQVGRITPFASGVDYLPTNMRIDAHAGERILSRAQNATFTSYMQRAMAGGGMGQRPIVNLNVQSTNIGGVEYVTVTEMNRVVNSAIDELATDWKSAASVPV